MLDRLFIIDRGNIRAFARAFLALKPGNPVRLTSLAEKTKSEGKVCYVDEAGTGYFYLPEGRLFIESLRSLLDLRKTVWGIWDPSEGLAIWYEDRVFVWAPDYLDNLPIELKSLDLPYKVVYDLSELRSVATERLSSLRSLRDILSNLNIRREVLTMPTTMTPPKRKRGRPKKSETAVKAKSKELPVQAQAEVLPAEEAASEYYADQIYKCVKQTFKQNVLYVWNVGKYVDQYLHSTDEDEDAALEAIYQKLVEKGLPEMKPERLLQHRRVYQVFDLNEINHLAESWPSIPVDTLFRVAQLPDDTRKKALEEIVEKKPSHREVLRMLSSGKRVGAGGPKVKIEGDLATIAMEVQRRAISAVKFLDKWDESFRQAVEEVDEITDEQLEQIRKARAALEDLKGAATGCINTIDDLIEL